MALEIDSIMFSVVLPFPLACRIGEGAGCGSGMVLWPSKPWYVGA